MLLLELQNEKMSQRKSLKLENKNRGERRECKGDEGDTMRVDHIEGEGSKSKVQLCTFRVLLVVKVLRMVSLQPF